MTFYLIAIWIALLSLGGSWALVEPWTRKFVYRTFAHKWFVFTAGWATGAPTWRLVVHDWSKFLPSEAPHYGRQYYGPRDQRWAFERAWHLHQRRHPHHWEYWVSPDYDVPLVMPEPLVREMVADWMAATRMIQGRWPEIGDWPWFEKNFRYRVRLHPATRSLVERILADVLPVSKKAFLEQVERAR